jgi:hypothetical protein
MSEAAIPKVIVDYVRRCVEGKEGTLPFTQRSVSLEDAYYSKVTKQYIVGSGILLFLMEITLSIV